MRDKGNGETQKQLLEKILKMKRKRIWSICLLQVPFAQKVWSYLCSFQQSYRNVLNSLNEAAGH